MRRALTALLTVLAVLALAGPAFGADDSLQRGRAEIGKSRALLDAALEAVKAGDRERAYELARTSYLDHFEFVEIPLRLRNPNLVLDLEFKFADLRDGIAEGAPVSELKDTRLEIVHGPLEAARAANYRRPLAWGVGAAVAATAALFALTATVVELAPVDRE